jgi:predicted nucleotidyltransferase
MIVQKTSSATIAPRIQEDLDRVVEEIAQLGGVDALILMGGFGRGEGSVVTIRDRTIPLNDYDLMIVTEKAEYIAGQVDELSVELATDFGIDFVEFDLVHPKALCTAPPSIYYYDLKYGSRVLWGDYKVLESLPAYRPEDIPLWEGMKLLFNRMAGLLSGFVAEGRHPSTEREYLYVRNQLVKAGVACGDALVLLYDRYHHLYSKRQRRFRKLAELGCLNFLEKSAVEMLDKAYTQKLNPDNQLDLDLWDWLAALLPHYELTFLHVMAAYTTREVGNVSDAVRYYLHTDHPRRSLRWWVQQLARSFQRGWATPDEESARKRAYGALPLVIFSCPVYKYDQKRLRWARQLLQGISSIHVERTKSDSGLGWEDYRQAAFEAWERFCH